MMSVLDWLAQRRKAVAGFVTPGVALLASDYARSGHLPTAGQWQAIAVICVLTAFGVHATAKNAEKTGDGPTGLN